MTATEEAVEVVEGELTDTEREADEQAALSRPESAPKPGDAGYDWSPHYDTTDLFTYTFPNGVVVALKPFGKLFSKTWLYKIRNLATNVDFEFAAIDRGSCNTVRELLEQLDDSGDRDPIAELYAAWSKDGTSRGDGDDGLTSGN